MFWNFLPKYREWPSYKLVMTEVSRILRNIFFPKYPRFWNLKLDFFPFRFFSAFFFQIAAHLSYLNSMCEKFQTNQRTFFSWKKVPITHKEFDFFFQKFQLEVGIFSDSKHFSHIFQIVAHLSYLNFISVDLKKNQRTF